jgi:RNA 2',3'-cyclic 3'-phosphodiesterase
MAKIRAFLALNASEKAQSEISEIKNMLSEIRSDVKWEPKDKFHITLKFLGDVEENLLKNLTEDLRYELNNFGQFELAYKNLGCFPNMKLPRVIWVGAEDNGKKIFALNKTIEAKTKTYNFENESNRFHPHITLGRVKGTRGVEEVIELLQSMEFNSINDLAMEVQIIKSTLQKSGSVYNVIDKINL